LTKNENRDETERHTQPFCNVGIWLTLLTVACFFGPQHTNSFRSASKRSLLTASNATVLTTPTTSVQVECPGDLETFDILNQNTYSAFHWAIAVVLFVVGNSCSVCFGWAARWWWSKGPEDAGPTPPSISDIVNKSRSPVTGDSLYVHRGKSIVTEDSADASVPTLFEMKCLDTTNSGDFTNDTAVLTPADIPSKNKIIDPRLIGPNAVKPRKRSHRPPTDSKRYGQHRRPSQLAVITLPNVSENANHENGARAIPPIRCIPNASQSVLTPSGISGLQPFCTAIPTQTAPVSLTVSGRAGNGRTESVTSNVPPPPQGLPHSLPGGQSNRFSTTRADAFGRLSTSNYWEATQSLVALDLGYDPSGCGESRHSATRTANDSELQHQNILEGASADYKQCQLTPGTADTESRLHSIEISLGQTLEAALQNEGDDRPRTM